MSKAKDKFNVRGSTLLKDYITFEYDVYVKADTHNELGILERVFKERKHVIPNDTAIVWISKNGRKSRKVYVEYNGDHDYWHFNFIHDL